MVKSMTGFGKAEAIAGEKKITVEIRTLNSKQLDLSVKLPAMFRSLDPDIRAAAAKSVQRGKCDLYINMESLPGALSVSIDDELFSAYYKRLGALASRNGIDSADKMFAAQMAASILRMPDVMNSNVRDVTDDEAGAVMGAVELAIAALEEFRATEGVRMMGDILPRVSIIHDSIDRIIPFEKERAETVRSRIRENIEKSGITVDDNRLEQEMIFYVEKLDITEEKVRLANHCDYFREVVETEENPGRKLGFIAQEMGREINTLGSKANHSEIQRIVVVMKDELEKIKEQLLNIL